MQPPHMQKEIAPGAFSFSLTERAAVLHGPWHAVSHSTMDYPFLFPLLLFLFLFCLIKSSMEFGLEKKKSYLEI
jgi:hypothetical protein